jgi:pimeloyl-ACP methyl ester carboxylesterase
MSATTVTTASGVTLRVERHGEGRPVVLLHGLLVDHRLWRKVVPALGDGVDAVVPTLPLGAHDLPAPAGADLGPPGLARMTAELLDALDLRDVLLVGNDTGGALAQLVAAHHPERLGGLVLTNCDAYERFFPPLFRPLQLAAKIPGGTEAIVAALQVPGARRLPIAYGKLSKRPIERAVTDAWATPSRHSAAIRHDLRAVLRGVDSRHLLDALPRLRAFEPLVTLAWAREDRAVFPPALAERLAGDFPDARIEWIEDSWTFVPEDQPAALAAILRTAALGSAQ